MGQPVPTISRNPADEAEGTQGSETSQYLEEKRNIFYSLSSGERKGKSPNPVKFAFGESRGVVRE